MTIRGAIPSVCRPITACHVERRDKYGLPVCGRIRYGALDLLWSFAPGEHPSKLVVRLYPKAVVAAMPEAERVEMTKRIVTLAFMHNGRRE